MNNRIFVNSPILLSEFCRGKRTRRIVAAISAFCMLTVGSPTAFAGTSLLGGKAVLEGLTRVTQGATTADSVTFNSSAAVGILDWSKYNIGAGQSMTYNGAGTTFFNLVNGAAGKSQIDGMINGNGSVWVINPSGVAFGSSAIVNVGGLFGVSAKALTDDSLSSIRGGSLPSGGLTFMEEGGAVEVSKGAQFNGNDIDFTTGDWAPGKQVALVGKKVTVEEGVFLNAEKINIAAAKGSIVADNVGGGTVSLKINDFAADTDINVDDINVVGVTFASKDGTPVETTGDLTVVTEGSIDIKGAVKADGDINLSTVTGNDADGNPVVVTHKTMSVASGKYLQGKSVTANAAGAVTIGGEGDSAEFAALDGILEITAQDINVVNATVKAGTFTVNETTGAVAIPTGHDAQNLTLTSGGKITVGGASRVGASGNVTLQKLTREDSSVSGGDIAIKGGSKVAANGNLNVDANGAFEVSGNSAVAAKGTATVTGAKGVSVDGSSVESVGNLSVTATTGDLVVKGASKLGTDGKLTANAVAGSLKAQDTAVLTAGGEGDLDGKTGVEVASGAKVLTKGDATVDATEGAVTVNGVVKAGDFEVDETTGAVTPDSPAAATLGIAGKSVDVDGGKVASSGNLTLTATDAAGTGVKAQNGAKVATLGTLEVGSANAVSVSGGSAVAAKGTATVTGATGVSVDGSTVESVGNLTVTATTGDLIAKSASKLGTDGKLTANAVAGSLKAQDTAVLTAGGEGDLDGNSGVEIASGAKVLAKGNATVDATEGAVTVKGLVKAGPFEVDEATGATTPADPAAATLGIAGKAVDVDGGKVAASGDLSVTATDAAGTGVKAQNGAKVATLGDLTVGSANAVSVSDASKVAAKGTATVTGAKGVSVDGSSVESVGNLSVTATTGDLVAKGASKLGTDGKLTANAVAGSLKAQDTAVLIAKDNVSLTAKNAVTVTGTAVVEAGKAVTVKSTEAGDITIDTTANVTANDGAVKIENANGAVTVRNATVEAKGDAGSVDIDATTGVTIQKGSQNAQVIAAQNVTVDTTGGGILVKDGSKVEATNGKLTADAATGSITVADKADVDAKTTLGLTAGTFVKVTENAQVNAGDAIAVMAKDGDVTVDASADVTSAKGVTITASKGVHILGDAKVTANGGDAVLTAQTEDVKVTGDIAASANVAVNANTTAEVSDNGTVKATAGNVSAVAQNAVTVKDTAKIEGNGVLLRGAAVETIGSASVKSTGAGTGGNLLIKATGTDVTLGEGTTIVASRNLKVEAAANVNQNTDVTAGGTAYVKADSGYVNMKVGTMTRTSGGNARFEAGQDMNIANVDVGDGGVSFAGHSVAVSGRITADGIGADLDGTFGTRENPVKLSVSELAVSAKKGIFIENSKDVRVVSQSAATETFQVNDVQEDLSDGGKVPTASDVSGRVVDGLLVENGDVELKNQGNVTVTQGARIQARSSVKADAEGNFTVDGDVEGSAVNVDAGSDIAVNGKVHSGGETALTAQGGITVAASATVDGSTVQAKADGAFQIDGTVTAGGENAIEAGGNVAFGAAGVAEGATVNVTAGGDITQDEAELSVSRGYIAQKSDIHAAVKASEAATLTAGGSVGGEVSGSQIKYVGVDAGNVSATAETGNAVIAAANGIDLTVGEGGIVAENGTATAYTMKTVRTEGKAVISGKDVNVTAYDYKSGNVNIKVNGKLTANNLEGGMNPGLAIFSTKGGKSNPKVDNLPNNMLIFIDGRMAGGDMQMINKLGALEAFPVATPELKSEQGIFGNPVFLHDQLDVSNPLAVGAIDFLLEDRAELVYGAEFPAEADMQIAINGLSPTTSYRFGQDEEEGRGNGEQGTGDEKQDGEKEGKPAGEAGKSGEAVDNTFASLK